MSKQVPFTVHIRVVPDRANGKRFEYIRDLQKLAVLAYEVITNISGVQAATPGGSVTQSMGDYNRRGGLGGFANAAACKPQIGAAPAQLMLTGFYEVSGNNTPTHAEIKRFSGGEIYEGSVAHSNTAGPTSTINTEVRALKTAIEAALASGLPDGAVYEVFRLDYAGVIYGDKGYHFPQS
jgi:hypothetical protein